MGIGGPGFRVGWFSLVRLIYVRRQRRKNSVTSTATETLPGRTPILDREAPLPPRAAPGSGLTVVLTAWLSVAVIVAACWLLNRPPIVREWFVTDFRPWCLDQFEPLSVPPLPRSLP